ncbi:hypothetical protein OKA04_23765 [Luteolibacter flavescens]|uniref:Uncharacterized protein n=1 Tax=Luteolibacter flavescens TaxID=1859460 RepID=A0ABT3FW07_9BACT|nr:hypothetical protein [Luteolibacter flavescens]MCW1887776.1 hypothetical protein [Luteolibacter flavescens]
MKRVPILLVIPLATAAVAVPWWAWTKDMDFMTQPSEDRLRQIRSETSAALTKPHRDTSPDAGGDVDREVQSPIKPPPVIDPGDPLAPAALDAFREFSDKGAAALIELAVNLEEQSGNARALLAWERVIDSCKPDDAQRAAATAGIQRLRPSVAPWSVDPLSKPLVLEAVLGKSTTSHPALEGLLDEAARITANSSAGLVKFVPRVDKPDPPQPAKKAKPKPKPKTKGKAKADPEPAPPPPPPEPPPLSLQILADGEKAASTGIIELALPEDPAELRREILRGVYRLVASQLAATTDFTPPDSLSETDEPIPALSTRITRLEWSEFGKSLQSPDRP